MKKIKRLLAMLLTLILCMGELWTTGITVFATDNEENAGGDSDVPEDTVAEKVLIDKTGTQGTQILIAGKNNYSSDEFTEGYTYLQDGEKLIAHNESGDYVAAEFTYGDEISELKLTNYKAGKEAGLKSADQIYYHGIKYTGNLKIICDGENSIGYHPDDSHNIVSPRGIEVDGTLTITNAEDSNAKLTVASGIAEYDTASCVNVTKDFVIVNGGDGSISIDIDGCQYGYHNQEAYNYGEDGENGYGLTVGESFIMESGSLSVRGGEMGSAIRCNDLTIKSGSIEAVMRRAPKDSEAVCICVDNDLIMYDGMITATGAAYPPTNAYLNSCAFKCKNADIKGGKLYGSIEGTRIYLYGKASACGVSFETISISGGIVEGLTYGESDNEQGGYPYFTCHTGVYISRPYDSSFSGGEIIGQGGRKDETHVFAYGVRLGGSLNLQGTTLKAAGSTSGISDIISNGESAGGIIQAKEIKGSDSFDGSGVVEIPEKTCSIATLKTYKYILAGGQPLKTYLVTFDMNGKTATDTPEVQTVEEGKTASKPEKDPKAEGYVFMGWYKDAAGTTEFDFSAPVTADTTVYAKWIEATVETYTVTFDLNGKTGVAPAPQIVEKGKTATKPATDPEAEGYMFEGWYKEAACTNEFDFTKAITEDTVIYAKWVDASAETYTFTFDLNGKEGAAPVQQIVEKSKTATKPSDPSAEGYKFIAWCTDKAGEKEYDFDAPVSANFTLYAKWEKAEEDGPGPVVIGKSALDPVPELVPGVTKDLYLVKGQKFNIGQGWYIDKADKESKRKVSISNKGIFKAKSEGEAVIKSGYGDTAWEVNVHISKPKMGKTLKLQLETDTEVKSEQLQFEYDKNLKVLWYSANPDVVTVDNTGKVTTVGKGTSKVTAYINGSAYSCMVKVTEKEPLLNRTLHVAKGSSKSISIKGLKNAEWEDFVKDIVSVQNNKVKGLNAGTTELSVSQNGKEYKVKVIDEDLTISGTGLRIYGKPDKNRYIIDELKVNDKTKLSFAGVTQSVVFKSSKPDVAFIDENLNVVIRGRGKAKFTAKINGKPVTITVNVK